MKISPLVYCQNRESIYQDAVAYYKIVVSFLFWWLTCNDNINKELKKYRPGQSNWELTMWKFKDFSATQFLREINFDF